MVERCKLCGRKLNSDSKCTNPDCPNCTKDKILSAIEEKQNNNAKQ